MKQFKTLGCAAAFAAACAGLSGFAVKASAEGLDELPPEIQSKLYNKDQIDPQQPVGPSAYRDFKAEEGPALDDWLREFLCREHLARECARASREGHRSEMEEARPRQGSDRDAVQS